MIEVTIKGKVYKFGFDSVWGPMYLYEEIAGEKIPFNPRKTMCLHLLFYCILMRANPGLDIELEEFLLCLNDVRMATSMAEYYSKRMSVLTGITSGDEAYSDSNKKKERQHMKYLG